MNQQVHWTHQGARWLDPSRKFMEKPLSLSAIPLLPKLTGMSMVLSKWIITPIKVSCKSPK